MPDGSLVVNELAPRVHNSGHWTIEGAATSQFEQHIRAICGLGLGSTAALGPAAMVNLLGTGPRRDARLARRRRGARRSRPSTSTCTTSARSSNAARWATSRRSGPRWTRRSRAARGALAQLWLGATTRRRRTTDDRGTTPDRPVVGIVGGSRSDFPIARGGRRGPRRARRAVRAQVVSAHRTPDRLFRYAEEAAGRGHPGHHRRRRRRRPSARACSPPRRPCRSSACRSRPSTWAASTRCSRSSRCRAACRSRRSASATPRTRACWRPRSWPSSDPALAERLAAWRARQTQAVLDDPSNAGRDLKPVLSRADPGRHGAADADVDRPQGRGRGDEQPPAVGAAEGAVARLLGQQDPPELDGGRVEDVDPVAGRRPDVALDIDPEAVATRPGSMTCEDRAARSSRPAVDDVEGHDVVVAARDPARSRCPTRTASVSSGEKASPLGWTRRRSSRPARRSPDRAGRRSSRPAPSRPCSPRCRRGSRTADR